MLKLMKFAVLLVAFGFSSIAVAQVPTPEMLGLNTGSRVATWVIEPDEPEHEVPIIYLHGGPGMYTEARRIEDGAVFRELGFSTIYFDQAGGGYSPIIPAAEYSVERAIADFEALRIQLGHDRLIIWGNSYGAIVATLYAERFPDRVAGLILTSPGTFPGAKPVRKYGVTGRKKFKVSKELQKAAKLADSNDLEAAELELSQKAAGALLDQHVSTNLSGGMICKKSALAAPDIGSGGNLYANRRIQNELAKLKFEGEPVSGLPTLILRGSCDFLPKKNAQRYQEHFSGTLIEISESGHGLLESRHEVEAALRSFALGELAAAE